MHHEVCCGNETEVGARYFKRVPPVMIDRRKVVHYLSTHARDAKMPAKRLAAGYSR